MLNNKYLSNFSFNTNQTYINDSYIQNIEEDEPGFANELQTIGAIWVREKMKRERRGKTLKDFVWISQMIQLKESLSSCFQQTEMITLDQALLVVQRKQQYGIYTNKAVEMITYDADNYFRIVNTLIPQNNRFYLNNMLDRMI